MRIARLVRILVVLPMLRNPVGRLALEAQAAKQGQRILQGTGAFERPVGEQAVIADANAEPAADGMQQKAYPYGRPTGIPHGNERPCVNDDEENYIGDGELIAIGNCWRRFELIFQATAP